MKNIGNDPRSLFNGNHFSSLLSRRKRAIARITYAGDKAGFSQIRSHIYVSVMVQNAHAELLGPNARMLKVLSQYWAVKSDQ